MMMEAGMRVSLSVKTAYPHVSDPRHGARQFLERVTVAQEQGFDGLFLGDHHITARTYLQNVPILARALGIWRDRRVGALFLLPLWPAVLLAEQIGTLAALTNGHFVVQCALGGGAKQFAAMDTALSERGVLFEQRFGVLMTLLSGDAVEVDVDGEPQLLKIAPVPSETVEVWIGAHRAVAIDRAARLGDTWYAAPGHPIGELRDLMDVYVRACERHAIRPRSVPLRREVYVAADSAGAERMRAAVSRSGGHRGFDPASLVIGVHGEVVEAFAELAEIGFTEVVCRQLAPDQQDALSSLERLGEVRRAVAAVTPASRFVSA